MKLLPSKKTSEAKEPKGLISSSDLKSVLTHENNALASQNQTLSKSSAEIILDLNTLRNRFDEEKKELTTQYQKYGQYLEFEKQNLEAEVRELETKRIKALAPLLLKKEELTEWESVLKEQGKKVLENLQESIQRKRHGQELVDKAEKTVQSAERKLQSAKNEENRIKNLREQLNKDSKEIEHKTYILNLEVQSVHDDLEKDRKVITAEREAISKEHISILESNKLIKIKEQQLEIREQRLKKNFDLARQKGIL